MAILNILQPAQPSVLNLAQLNNIRLQSSSFSYKNNYCSICQIWTYLIRTTMGHLSLCKWSEWAYVMLAAGYRESRRFNLPCLRKGFMRIKWKAVIKALSRCLKGGTQKEKGAGRAKRQTLVKVMMHWSANNIMIREEAECVCLACIEPHRNAR